MPPLSLVSCPADYAEEYSISKQISCDLCNVTGGFQDNGTPTKHLHRIFIN